MIKLNIRQAKTHLSRYLKAIEAGETIVLCRHNVPIAEIRPLPKQRKTPRQLGTAKGQVAVPPEFFEPLPEGSNEKLISSAAISYSRSKAKK